MKMGGAQKVIVFSVFSTFCIVAFPSTSYTQAAAAGEVSSPLSTVFHIAIGVVFNLATLGALIFVPIMLIRRLRNKKKTQSSSSAINIAECPKCRQANEIGKKFCPKCGVSLVTVTPTTSVDAKSR